MGFSIPFSVEALAANVVEVQLLVSVDRGTTWHPYARQLPADKAFRFRAPRDGEYWFSSRTVDRQGQTRPAGQPQPQLIVVIDTTLPKIQLLATPGPSGEVTVRWELADERLAPETFQLFYLAGISGTPQPVVVPASLPTGAAGTYHGQVTFWPQGGGRLAQLTAEVKDAAGNRAVAGKRVYLNPSTRARPGVVAGGLAAAPFGAQPNGMPLAGAPPYTPPPYVPPGSTAPGVSGAPAAPSTTGYSAPPPSTPSAPAGQGWTSVAPGAAAAGPGMLVGASAARMAPGATGSSGGSNGVGGDPSASAGTMSGDLPGGERPRMTNSKRFALEYDIESAGPGGVSDVELWATRDRGATWTKMATDADKQSPFDVSVDEEGVYGFRVVVVSKSGLISSAPRPGDLADIWVGVDVTPPKVQFSSISFGEGDAAGKLDIRWEADDLRMSPRPVKLSYAEQANGPWTDFANGLPNNGQYYWSIAGQAPQRVLLRIEVRDDAGNVGTYQLAEPISLQGLNPAGRIRGFTPAASPTSGAKRQPLFAPRRL